MIFFVGNDGTVIKSVPSPVYQGSAGANDIYLIAPFAENLQATVAFKLPNGVWKGRYLMTPLAKIEGVINENTGKPYSGWKFSLPNEITQFYGTVTAQFFFYTGNTEQVVVRAATYGVITATSATAFTVGKGVPEVLPEKPTDDEIYNIIINNISALSNQVNNGYFSTRAIYAWDSKYSYGANEVTFYPDKGKFGAFIKSLVVKNTQPPYNEDGTLNSESWEEIVSFDHIADGYFTELKSLASASASSEANAKASALAAEHDRQEAEHQATNAEESARQAEVAETTATEQATIATNSAAQASTSEQNAEKSAQEAENARLVAANWAEIAKQYAQFGIKINTEYKSASELPLPGNSQYIYLIPNGSSGNNSYDEYMWVESKEGYEKIGTTEVDLTDYATIAKLSEEENARATADDALGERIDNEEEARISADEALNESIAEVEADIYTLKTTVTGKADKNGSYPNMSVGQAKADEYGDNIANSYVKKSGGIITGDLVVKGRQYVHSASGGNNAGYVRFAKLTIQEEWSDMGVFMTLSRRGADQTKSIFIRFANVGNLTPSIASFTYWGSSFPVYALQDSSNKSVWYLLAEKESAYDQLQILNYTQGNYNPIKVEWLDTRDASLPAGSTLCIGIGEIVLENSGGNKDTYLISRRTDTGRDIRFGVGSGGNNRGIWDDQLKKWIFHADENNNIYINQKRVTPAQISLNSTVDNQMDTVVKYSISSDGTSWYRIWASGWKECGSTYKNGNQRIHTSDKYGLPVKFSTQTYQIQVTPLSTSSSNNSAGIGARAVAQDAIKFVVYGLLDADRFEGVYIYCCGY